jgi:four helix bundle protein
LYENIILQHSWGLRTIEFEDVVKISREPAKTFEDLLVWKKAHSFVLTVYRLTETFPKHEIFGLTSQFRRAAVSIPANIAEGFRRYGTSDKVRFFNIAQTSVEECRYYLILVKDLEYADVEEAYSIIQEVSKMLEAYIRSILNPES